MEDDMWRADGSFRGISGGGGGGGGKGGGGKSGGGPQFNRVIPKFLQKFHQGPVGPAISTKFALPPDDDDDDSGELDDVQKAAMEEYLNKDKEKKDAVAKAAGADVDGEETAEKEEEKKTKKPKKQRMAELGKDDSQTKKRKRKPTGEALKNKKLLSFSMDDEE